ncbi:hypothetical protein Taro_026242 [Colocasia esculenta]|uniref:DOG1 domain-containing protein n=1 Tax=Colocasia esculenta TaxID=4460 RepID=A0A843VBF2_COLES|nr:hypothetical protein [Colocasia esculenta]
MELGHISHILCGYWYSRNKEAGAYDLGDLDQALFQYLQGQEHSPLIQEQRREFFPNPSQLAPPMASLLSLICVETLNIFPSVPMHVHVGPSTKGVLSTASSASNVSKESLEQSMEPRNPTRSTSSLPNPGKDVKPTVKQEGAKKVVATSSSELEGTKTPDAKILRRLAQNREAARKSRLRKKGVFFGGGVLGEQGMTAGIGAGISSGTSHIYYTSSLSFKSFVLILYTSPHLVRVWTSLEAAMFDMEYGRWLEEHHRLMCELRAAVQEHLPEGQLKMFVDSCLAHFDELMGLRAIAAKTDVFHLEDDRENPDARLDRTSTRVLLSHIEPLSEQQILAIYALRTSTHETEDALTQGLEALHQSLSDTIASGDLSCPSNMADYMGQMAVAMNKLSTLEGFVRQITVEKNATAHKRALALLDVLNA